VPAEPPRMHRQASERQTGSTQLWHISDFGETTTPRRQNACAQASQIRIMPRFTKPCDKTTDPPSPEMRPVQHGLAQAQAGPAAIMAIRKWSSTHAVFPAMVSRTSGKYCGRPHPADVPPCGQHRRLGAMQALRPGRPRLIRC